MRFPRRLITPVLAAVMLVGGAAYAQDAIAEGESGAIGPLSWSYDDGVFTWGDTSECEDAALSPTESTEAPETEIVVDGDLLFDDCHVVEFGDPGGPDDPSYTAVVGVPTDGEEGNHGQFVSEFGKVLKEIPKDDLDGNRGSFMRVIAKLNPFKDNKDDTDVDDESETTLEEADEDSDKPDKATKEDNPNKANGKQDK